MNRTLLALAVVILTVPAVAAAASAESSGSFGVSPVRLTFTEPSLLRGASAEGTLTIQNGFHEPTDVTLTPKGELANWVSVDETAFKMNGDTSRALKVRVTVPQDAANGLYEGLLHIRAVGTGSPSGSGASIHVEVLPAIQIRVGGEQVIAFAAEHVHIDDRAPSAPIILTADTLNRGNVRAAPAFDVVIRDKAGATVLQERVEGARVEPSGSATQPFALSRGLPKGTYTATATLESAQGEATFSMLTFDVFDGAGAAVPLAPPSGVLVSLVAEKDIQVNAPAAFTARFDNDGSAVVTSAQLTVELSKDGRRVDIIKSDALRAEPGQSINLEAFFRPAETGAYTYKGYVTYDGMRTAIAEGAFQLGGTTRASSGSTAQGANVAAGDASSAAASADTPPAGQRANVPAPGVGLLVAVLGTALVAVGGRSRK